MLSCMSLTSLVRYKTPVRERMALDFPRPKLSLQAKLQVPSLATNRPMIGTAFDYLLRFHLQRNHNFSVSFPWVAESAHGKISEYGDAGILLVSGHRLLPSGQIRDSMARYIRRARRLLTQFIAGAPVTADLARAAMNLAHCDVFYRAHKIDERFGKPSVAQIDELLRLIEAVDWSQLRAERICLLNPRFGEGSTFIGGADADLLLDDTLIDVKTTASLRIRVEDWRQLIGYAALNEHFPIGGGSDPMPLRRIGFYFSRFGYLASWPIAELVDMNRFAAFAAWLRAYAHKMHTEDVARQRAFDEWEASEKLRTNLMRAKRRSKRKKPVTRSTRRKKKATSKVSRRAAAKR